MRLAILAALLLVVESQRSLKVGLFCSNSDPNLQQYIGFTRVAAGVMVGWNRVLAEGLLPGTPTIKYPMLALPILFPFSLTWKFDECIESVSARYEIDFIQQKYDVTLGPPCSQSAIIAGTIAKYYDFPLFMWGPPYSSQLTQTDEFPTIVAVTYSTMPQAVTLVNFFEQYGFQDIAMLWTVERSSLIPRCSYVMSDLETAISNVNDVNVAYNRQVTNNTVARMAAALTEIKAVARGPLPPPPHLPVVVLCFESPATKRNFLLGMVQAGMAEDQYVYVYLENRRTGYNQANGTIPSKVWIDQSYPPDGQDAVALQAARKTFILDFQPLNDTADYIQQVKTAFTLPPFNCTNCTDIDTMANNMSGSVLADNAVGEFQGETGTVRITQNGTRDPIFILYGLDSGDNQQAWILIDSWTENSSSTFHNLYTDESQLWVWHGGVRPLNTPACGFTGNDCPLTFAQQYLVFVIIAVIVFILIIIAVIAAFCYIMRTRRREEEELNRLWQVQTTDLQKPSQKNMTASAHSLQSSVTNSTRFTLDSKKDTEKHAFFLLFNEPVAARKHPTRIVLGKHEAAEMRQVRAIDQENLNKFVGLVLDGPQFMSVWKYCSRGSLRDVIEKGTLQMDWFFKFSLIRDVSEGIYYLHHSPIGAHGWLTSGTCLVDERWQLKITYYGLNCIKDVEKKTFKDFLWTAPELIREGNSNGTKPGDIYSFAIIASEIITRKNAWDLENQAMEIDELVYKIKRGGRIPVRPSLENDDTEMNSSMMLLIKDCWSETPEQRPNVDQVKTLLKSLNHGRSANLMDHVFNVLEQYASHLEEEVESRMKELIEEKKKSDILLYRMLPKQVAEKLKLGQSVEPETFECVTIFFSDVVSFTTLASRCTPLQVVNLLNDLYSAFDAIIDEHDVYKVETIGDGYLCVSGLPHRNGNEHAREIAEMSFSLLQAIKRFRIPHMPSERINIRIGIHTGMLGQMQFHRSGPCVAGVVGITMPRYCLFGDSVNTAARMESNGKPGRIHISEETHKFLTAVIGGYRTEPRGEVLIKGKGTLNTHWLIDPNDVIID